MTPLTITSLDQGHALGQDNWRKLTTEPPDKEDAPAAPRRRAPGLFARLLRLRLRPASV